MRRLSVAFVVLVLTFSSAWAKPVNRGPPQPPVEEHKPEDNGAETGLAYDSYLRQVVEVLESDDDFRKKLETANVSDIKSGKIAMYLDMVNHTVRTRLDEIKRREISRLQDLVRAQIRTMTDPKDFRKNLPTHLDLNNPHSFEMKDLETLIKKTTSDLEELDKQRKEEFKDYEMEKKFEEEEKLKQMKEDEREEEKKRLEELKKKHADHPKINHPGSRDQFEEVWDKVDHLEDQEFNPKTFFFQHDINGDMEWSIEEVDAVLQLELDKVYDEKNSPEEDDPVERQEEMNRMREHVFKEMDKDHNQRISLQEFLEYTGQNGENEHFKEDDGWKTLDEEEVFSDDDYARFLEEHHAQPGVIDVPSNNLQFEPEHPQGVQLDQAGQHQLPPQGQQQFQQQPPQGGQQQQFQQQPPQGGQQQQVPQSNTNMNQMSAEEQQKLQQQLKDMKAQLEEQQKKNQV
ncbi:nucleobindin-2 [Elysia marginata]|uniref:Nucleobindin-2 n=1 Tax=Elysia marginata TaxID=1093978 RepID=A0AAV4EK93_9GAST|nr:nucleobindin-2 [Elysia marginata]